MKRGLPAVSAIRPCAARVNLFGVFVLQVDYVKPLDRPGKSAFFQFNLLTGF